MKYNDMQQQQQDVFSFIKVNFYLQTNISKKCIFLKYLQYSSILSNNKHHYTLFRRSVILIKWASSNTWNISSIFFLKLWQNIEEVLKYLKYWNNKYWNNKYWNNNYQNNKYWSNKYWNNKYWSTRNESLVHCDILTHWTQMVYMICCLQPVVSEHYFQDLLVILSFIIATESWINVYSVLHL